MDLFGRRRRPTCVNMGQLSELLPGRGGEPAVMPGGRPSSDSRRVGGSVCAGRVARGKIARGRKDWPASCRAGRCTPADRRTPYYPLASCRGSNSRSIYIARIAAADGQRVSPR